MTAPRKAKRNFQCEVYKADLFKIIEIKKDYKMIEIKTHSDNWKDNQWNRQY